MSELNWTDKDLGAIDAYAFAVENGYFSGTREQWYAMISGTTQNASDAEAYAKGTRAGEAVTSDDPAYHNNSSYWNDQAGDNAENAEAWANGTRDGVDVTSGDPAYEKNSKYWEGQAALQKAAAQAAAETASAAYNVNLLAPNYDATSTYAVGAHVIYSGGYYECISAITTAEAWTAAHWRQLTVGGEASSLKSAIDQLGVEFYNLFDPDNIHDGKYLDGNGVLSSNATYATTKFIDISDYESVAFSFTNWGAWYSTDNESGFISPLNSSEMNSLSSDKSATVPTNAKYLRVTVQKSNIDKVQIGRIADRNNYVGHKRYLLPDVDVKSDQIRGVEYLEENLGYSKYNLFDKNNVNDGKYLDGNGALSTNASYVTSVFLDISDLSTVSFSYTTWGAWYSTDDESGFIAPLNTTGMSTETEDKTVAVPSGAKYVRATAQKTNIDKVQIGVKVDRNTYISHDKVRLNDVIFVNVDESIIVAKNGSGNYTSLTEAVYENIENGIPIIVKPGIYNVKEEYIALFGQDVVDNLADSTTGIENFQYGIRICNRVITFEPGSHVVCDWTGHTVDGTHRFSVFRVEQGTDIRGLHLTATGTFYAIHDDYGPATPFTIKYSNCHIDGYNIFNANCIGGGCHKYSNHILENCYFNNHVDSSDIVLSADVRYHNTNTADAEPEIHISNCYFSNNFNAAYYGTQTSKARVYVNNCYAPKGINKVRESSSMNTDNVDLYTWNNQTN